MTQSSITRCTGSVVVTYLKRITWRQSSTAISLYAAVEPLMPKGQFGSRHLQKHLWRLPIPEFDGGDSLHAEIADAGRQAAVGVEGELERLGKERPGFTVTIARREIRKWLRESVEGQQVEEVVGELLGG